jgi:hypothetical protein
VNDADLIKGETDAPMSAVETAAQGKTQGVWDLSMHTTSELRFGQHNMEMSNLAPQYVNVDFGQQESVESERIKTVM